MFVFECDVGGNFLCEYRQVIACKVASTKYVEGMVKGTRHAADGGIVRGEAHAVIGLCFHSRV